jgi:predicted DNA repair protein MutK
MLVVMCAKHKNKALFFLTAAVGMIGIEDIVNSFCHLRMPVLVTTLSSTYSLIFGIIIGSIIVVIIKKLLTINWKELLQK